MEKKYVANKALIVNQHGKILLIRYSGSGDHSNSKGKLDVPGGRMDHDEHPLKALAREIKEETGLELYTTHATPIHVDLWGVRGDIKNEPIVGIYYKLLLRGDVEVQLSDEHTEVVWCDPHATLPDNLNDSIVRAIEAYRAHEGIVTGQDVLRGRQGYGLIQLFTGDGKGKTTASLGESIRAVGAGKKVGIVYFDKGGAAYYNERTVIDGLEHINYIATGRDRIDPSTGGFDFSIQEVDKAEARRGLKEVDKMFQGDYDVVIMDEINSTTDLGMLTADEVIEVIDHKPDALELIMTGRSAPQAFIDRAHLVTEMKLRKHYFYSGVKAREGLDY